jgi:hypothetical protein
MIVVSLKVKDQFLIHIDATVMQDISKRINKIILDTAGSELAVGEWLPNYFTQHFTLAEDTNT